MAESIEEMETALELYRRAIETGEITKQQLDALPGGAGKAEVYLSIAPERLKELDPKSYPQRLEDALRLSRLRFPHVEQK